MSSIVGAYKDPKKFLSEPSLGDAFTASFLPGLDVLTGLSYLGSKYSEATTPKMPAPPVAPVQDQEETDTAVKEAAYSEAERLRKKKGLRSTQVTGPAGITNPPTTFKTKLG